MSSGNNNLFDQTYTTLTLKCYNKIGRATGIISHSSSERRSTFDAFL